MNFLNPEENTRIKIKKIADQPKPPAVALPTPGLPGAPAKAGAAPAPGAKPGLGGKPGVAVPGKPGVPGAAKPGAPAPTSVAAVVKAKQPPKVQVLQVEPGIFEVHFTCSCGEEYVIRCDSAEKSSAALPPQ